MKSLVLTILLFSPAILYAQESIPGGTILPVRLETTLSSKASHPGQKISAKVMQDVQLADGRLIRAGAHVTGHVVDATPSDGGTGARFSFQFDTLDFSKKTVPIRTDLRALASLLEVDGAQIPETGPDRGTPPSAWITDQIGGETVYRGGGHVMNAGQVVGEPAPDGILARVSPNPGAGCRGAVNENDRPQSLWVFSSYACGLYGYTHLRIVHAGRTDPTGVIILSSQTGEWKVWSGSGMLLRVN